jgi:hypothetical protein
MFTGLPAILICFLVEGTKIRGCWIGVSCVVDRYPFIDIDGVLMSIQEHSVKLVV